MEIYELTVHELMDKLEKKELTSTQITESYLKRIEEKEKDVQAFVTITEKARTLIVEPFKLLRNKLMKTNQVKMLSDGKHSIFDKED